MSKLGTISHVAISVSDFETSTKFYTFLLTELLGYKAISVLPDVIIWAKENGLMIVIRQGTKTPSFAQTNPGLHHLSFRSETKEQIDELFGKIVQFQEQNQAIQPASKILAEPAPYPQYVEGYYS
ncbi:hypothetical protein BGZ99_004212 [Dissophora globulifera]|uniref:Glyoxalase/fosfomycin resistance/dioxygenase domain-containing protein n=1 Tax=Dissophora globulifera TaxID=979702 RepID=A0A9P6RIF9_9FUNG|nr:hypothetical protein BGZ99_004212 [Dissophora globulifera]